MGMWLRRLALGLAVWAGLALGAAVQSAAEETKQIGGPGGAPFRVDCAGDGVLTGFDYEAGKALDWIIPLCRAVRGGHVVGDHYVIGGGIGQEPASGSSGFSSFTAGEVMECPTDTAVMGLRVSVDKFSMIHHIQIYCRALAENAPQTILRTTNSGGEADWNDTVTCGPGMSAVGVVGGAWAQVDRLGLVCGKTHEVAPPPPAEKPAEKPPARAPLKVTNDQAPLKVDNGAGGDGGGGGGDYAAVDTTIYDAPGGDEIDYISEGDPVTIRSCDDGWCRITEPRRGYVWGEDLGR